MAFLPTKTRLNEELNQEYKIIKTAHYNKKSPDKTKKM